MIAFSELAASPFADWDGTPAAARVLQKQLAEQVHLKDDYPPLRLLAGVDVGFEEGGEITRAAAILLDAETLQPLAECVARIPTSMPYVPGLLSFRELPALITALAGLPQEPDLIVVDGHGIAHPRGLGIAAHLGVVSGRPTIGVAKKILTGQHGELGEERGDKVELLDRQGRQIAWMLRSKRKVRPLIVSPGHRVGMDSAVALVLDWGRGYRLPEPTRLADRLASRRDTKGPKLL
ncbi:deoxyribonuclease V [Pseudomonas sp. BIGb0408]|uniref:Endonuclease V n=1 Tax=Phytopseudomonas flavescens TaxID=29435 RepID=A0A7Z0BRX6_9GAMM|nr:MULTISPECIES: deoxyribonuclease V [Pseudomonas]MCW2290719.1 deoxyribonuclease V [Pseudomonas sp. BIGb0408]NYH74708.1 deoxyribonuclease V [Pseudomonas flavescens]